jgi:hypothetical protein
MTATRTTGRARWLVALVATLLLAMALPTPALAGSADTYHFRGESAFAHWTFDDSLGTSVFAAGLDGEFQTDGEAHDVERVFVGVFQDFCDEGADEQVFRSFFGFGDTAVDVDHARLSEASAETSLDLHGVEYRIPDCEDPDYDDYERKDLGEHDVDVTGDWDATSDLDTRTDRFHFDFDGFKFRSQDMERYREAEADGGLAGLEDFGVPADLGTSDSGEIASFNDSTVIVDHSE